MGNHPVSKVSARLTVREGTLMIGASRNFSCVTAPSRGCSTRTTSRAPASALSRWKPAASSSTVTTSSARLAAAASCGAEGGRCGGLGNQEAASPSSSSDVSGRSASSSSGPGRAKPLRRWRCAREGSGRSRSGQLHGHVNLCLVSRRGEDGHWLDAPTREPDRLVQPSGSIVALRDREPQHP